MTPQLGEDARRRRKPGIQHVGVDDAPAPPERREILADRLEERAAVEAGGSAPCRLAEAPLDRALGAPLQALATARSRELRHAGVQDFEVDRAGADRDAGAVQSGAPIER
jgi:hypothetical protein